MARGVKFLQFSPILYFYCPSIFALYILNSIYFFILSSCERETNVSPRLWKEIDNTLLTRTLVQALFALINKKTSQNFVSRFILKKITIKQRFTPKSYLLRKYTACCINADKDSYYKRMTKFPPDLF